MSRGCHRSTERKPIPMREGHGHASARAGRTTFVNLGVTLRVSCQFRSADVVPHRPLLAALLLSGCSGDTRPTAEAWAPVWEGAQESVPSAEIDAGLAAAG